MREFIFSGFYIGLLPAFAASAASFAALMINVIVTGFFPEHESVAELILTGLFLIAGFASIPPGAEKTGEQRSTIVIDDMTGMLLALCLIPPSLPYFIAAFLLFRLFDNWSIWPAASARRLTGAWGIMVNDLIVGLYAGALPGGVHLLLKVAGVSG